MSTGKLKAFDMDSITSRRRDDRRCHSALADGTSTCATSRAAREGTDRIAAMATELRKLGATIEERWTRSRSRRRRVSRRTRLSTHTTITASRCVFRCGAGRRTRADNDPECVGKTFPGIFRRARSGQPCDAHEHGSAVIAIDGRRLPGKGTVAQKVRRPSAFTFSTAARCTGGGACASTAAWISRDAPQPCGNHPRPGRAVQGDSVRLDGADVSKAIRAENVGGGPRRSRRSAPCSEALLTRQRAFRERPGWSIRARHGVGRCHRCAIKIFLTAEPPERARRRYKQLMAKGLSASMDALLQEIRERDARDSRRAVAPLQKCEDAIAIDSTAMSVGEAVARVLALYKERVPKAP